MTNLPLSLEPPTDEDKLPPKKPLSVEKKMVETSGRATEEGSLSQDGQSGNRCCVCTEQTNMIKLQYGHTIIDRL